MKVALIFLLTGTCILAGEYLDNPKLEERLESLARKYRKFAKTDPLIKGVPLLELGAGSAEERAGRPALLAVAGIEGNDLAGPSILVTWAEQLLADEESRDILERATVYIVPRLNAGAAEAFFRKPRREQPLNSRPVDEDHDGLADEDGPDDLNGDGMITSMRVEDPEGEYIVDPADPRLLMKADRAKGETGAWRLLTEGRDNDDDEDWNEDGPGGVNLNRNFPYNYKHFAPTAGPHQMSEPPTRALAEFVVAHPNIAAAFTFGAADNLSAPPKADAQGAAKRPPTAMQEDDIAWYRELGKLWRESLGLKKELSAASEAGTFSDWIYFHRGRLSLAARPWTTAMQLALSSAKPEKEEKKDESKADKRNQEERAFLKWLTENSPEAFIEWKAFEHPDFPGRKVEIGGFAPFAKTNPPEKMLEELATGHGKFLTELIQKFPRAGVRKAEVRNLGNQVFDIVLRIENTGYLPTLLSQGNTTREVHPTRVVLNLPDAAILSGTRVTILPAIPGSGGMREIHYVVQAKGKSQVEVEVTSALGGALRERISLK